MPNLLPTAILFVAAIAIHFTGGPYADELPAFITEYKKSDTYWLSAVIGAYYGASGLKLVPGYNPIILGLIFFVPPILYFVLYRPYGINCYYRPVDSSRSVIDTFAQRENIAQKEDGDWTIDLQIKAGSHIDKYSLEFDVPPGAEIDFVDYQSNKVQEFDDLDNELKINSTRDDDLVVGVYVSESDGALDDDRDFNVNETTSGRTLTTISLVN